MAKDLTAEDQGVVGAEFAEFNAKIDRCLEGMRIIQQKMDEDQKEIKALQQETRAMLAELAKAA